MRVTNLFEDRYDEGVVILSRISGSTSQPASVVLNKEHDLNLYHNGTLLHNFVCSPAALDELCVGWLLSEGYQADLVEILQDGQTATVQGLSPISTDPDIAPSTRKVTATAQEMLTLFNQASDKYCRSHGIHECVLKGNGWQILRTDIGRHNAIDKAVGAAHMAGHDLAGAVMFTSGRINVQTVKKAARCKLSCLMSKAVITAEALALAEQLGLEILFSVIENSYMTK